jgi:SPP1 gp7 family putative phage head morphogenesis protein
MASKEILKTLLKMKRKKMGKANRKKSQGIPKGKTWLYPHNIERTYKKGITELQREFTVPVTKTLVANLERWTQEYKGDSLRVDAFGPELKAMIEREQERLNRIYGENAPRVRAFIYKIGENVSAFNLAQGNKLIESLLGIEFLTTELWEEEVIQIWEDTNFELIKSLSEEYIKRVNTLVADGVQFGKGYSEIMKEIKALNKNITQARASLIARDQVGKLNGVLTERRMSDAGIDMYEWLTAGDERVRSSHQPLNNKLCRWDDNGVYSADKGDTWKSRTSEMTKSIPGQDIQCRCTAIPFFGDLIAEIDEEIEGDENE